MKKIFKGIIIFFTSILTILIILLLLAIYTPSSFKVRQFEEEKSLSINDVLSLINFKFGSYELKLDHDKVNNFIVYFLQNHYKEGSIYYLDKEIELHDLNIKDIQFNIDESSNMIVEGKMKYKFLPFYCRADVYPEINYKNNQLDINIKAKKIKIGALSFGEKSLKFLTNLPIIKNIVSEIDVINNQDFMGVSIKQDIDLFDKFIFFIQDKQINLNFTFRDKRKNKDFKKLLESGNLIKYRDSLK